MNYKLVNPDYKPVSFGEVVDGSNEWLAMREHGPKYDDPTSPDYIPVVIGGSSVAVIFGDSPWKSKLELFHEKTGITPKYEKKKNQVILDSGHQLEEWVALTFKRRMVEEGCTVELINDTNMYQHPFYKFAVGNFDRRIKVNGISGLLECKTCSNWDDIKNYWQNGICPKKYEWQCRYYMAIANVDFIYITCCWGMGADDNTTILIERDLNIEELMFNEVADFVEHCLDGEEPSLDESENVKELSKYYTRLYGEISEDAPPVELPDTDEVYTLIKDAEDIFDRKAKIQATMDSLLEEEARITCNLMKLTGGESTYATYRMDDDTVVALKLKLPLKRASFDEERLKTEKPDVYGKYIKQEEKFDVTKFKKENKKEANAYIIPGKVDPEKPVTLKEVKHLNISSGTC